jgi:hypothetical protein
MAPYINITLYSSMAGILFGLFVILAQKNFHTIIRSEDEPKLKILLFVTCLLPFFQYIQLLSKCDFNENCNDDTTYYLSLLPVSK